MIELGIKTKNACRLMDIPISTLYYKSNKVIDDTAVAERIKQIAFENTFYGYRRIYHILQKEGFTVNRKRVYRIYKSLNLQRHKPRKHKKLVVSKSPLTEPTCPNHVWAIDFVFDRLS